MEVILNGALPPQVCMRVRYDMDILRSVALIILHGERLLVNITEKEVVLGLSDIVQFFRLFDIHFLVVFLENNFAFLQILFNWISLGSGNFLGLLLSPSSLIDCRILFALTDKLLKILFLLCGIFVIVFHILFLFKLVD